ncbi:putative membrane protein [Acinetobacter sp. 263903-1]|nr:putative membrane protein [Acinetobacter sp. 1294596]KCX38844.1 putative membrane protein [Acinetobacter sp. 263903-1]
MYFTIVFIKGLSSLHTLFLVLTGFLPLRNASLVVSAC